jgi:hypothetical protein
LRILPVASIVTLDYRCPRQIRAEIIKTPDRNPVDRHIVKAVYNPGRTYGKQLWHSRQRLIFDHICHCPFSSVFMKPVPALTAVNTVVFFGIFEPARSPRHAEGLFSQVESSPSPSFSADF